MCVCVCRERGGEQTWELGVKQLYLEEGTNGRTMVSFFVLWFAHQRYSWGRDRMGE